MVGLAGGGELTVLTVNEAALLQPYRFLVVTVYGPPEDTSIRWLVAPVLQLLSMLLLDVRPVSYTLLDVYKRQAKTSLIL